MKISNKPAIRIEVLGVFVVLIAGLILFSLDASAIPNTITIQGKLTNPSGAPQVGRVNFTFAIYDAYTGGNRLYELANKNITTDSNGIYDTILPNVNVNFSGQYYLGVTVNLDGESSPRINLSSSPSAFRANVSEDLNPANTYKVSVLNVTSNLYASQTLFVSSNLVGIGTTSPSNLLHLESTTAPQFRIAYDGTNKLTIGAMDNIGTVNFIVSGNDPTFNFSGGDLNSADTVNANFGAVITTNVFGKITMADSYNSRPVFLMGPNDDTDAFRIHNNGYWFIHSTTAESVVLGANSNISQLVLISGGNVGIGDTTPDASLEIVNDASGDSFLVADNSDGDTTPFVIQNDGDVGIGTTSPNEKLTVIGNANVSGTLNVSGIVTFANLASCSSIQSSSTGVLSCGSASSGSSPWNSTASTVYLNDSSAKVGIGTSSPSHSLTVVGNTSLRGNLSVSGNVSFDGTTFFVDANSDKVGIGTVTPTAQLNAHSASGASQIMVSTDVDIGSANDASFFFESDRDGTPNNAGIGQFADGSLRFTGASSLVTPDMVIDDNGKVGIATKSPSDQLHVIGSVRFAVNDTNNVSTTNVLTLDHFIKNPLNSTGGIGTGLLFRAMDNGSNTDDVALINATLTNSLNGTEASSIGFYTRTSGGSLSPRMTIDNNGRMGIGTTNPQEKLVVIGNANISGTLNVSGLITAGDVTCSDCLAVGDLGADSVGASELASGAVTAAGTELDSTIAGNGIGLSGGALVVNTGTGITITSDNVAADFTSVQAESTAFKKANMSGVQSNSTGWNRTSTNVILANQGDNVGIGVAGPVDKLTVAASTGGGLSFIPAGNGGNVTRISSRAYADNVTNAGYLDFITRNNWGSDARLWLGRESGGGLTQNAFRSGVVDDSTGYPNQNTHTSFNSLDANGLNSNAVIYIGYGSNSSNTRQSLYTENGAIFAATYGNVGIGTASPNDALEVVGSVRVSGSLNASSINATRFYVPYNGLQDGKAIHFINSSGDGDGAQISQRGTDLDMRMISGEVAGVSVTDSSGNFIIRALSSRLVGINTPSPVGSLTVYPTSTSARGLTVNSNSGQTEETFQSWTSGSVKGLTILDNRLRIINKAYDYGGPYTDYEYLDIQPVNNIYTFNSLAGGNGTARPILFQANVGINTSITANTSDSYALQVGPGANGKSVNLSNVLYVNGTNGSVGIGITDPRGTLHVSKSTAPTGYAIDDYYLILGRRESATASTRLIGFGYVDTQPPPAYIGYLTTSTTGSEKGALVFGTRDVTSGTPPGTERLRIDTVGNVGINTTSPAQALTVQGTLNVTPAGQGATPSIFVKPGASGSPFVGIGTASPGLALDVLGSINANNSYILGGATIMQFDTPENKNLRIGDFNDNGQGVQLWAANTQALTINDSTANVGIGIGNPGYKLEIGGGATGASPAPILSFSDYYDNAGDPSVSHIDLYGGTYGIGVSAGTLNYISDDAHAFYDDSSLAAPAFFIDGSAGNVGVGTKTPQATLHVNATTGAAIRLSTSGGTDYSRIEFFGAGSKRAELQWDELSGKLNLTTTSSSWPLLLQTSGGKVGIGTTAPTKTLSVSGAVNAVVIDPSATPNPVINTTGNNLTITSASGSVIIRLG
ncbi:MAG TPA: hypothetical protein VI564_05235 [Candidatus Nanoarchaeia archaeon]|nr:hypothetical protein [Candidatus Nanoarchaeia archaeon]